MPVGSRAGRSSARGRWRLSLSGQRVPDNDDDDHRWADKEVVVGKGHRLEVQCTEVGLGDNKVIREDGRPLSLELEVWEVARRSEW